MYVHIGGEYVLSDKYIVGVFDFDKTTGQTSDTIRFLRREEQAAKLETVSLELPRSFVVTLDRTYLTPISTVTLRRRLDHQESAFSREGTDDSAADETESRSYLKQVNR